MSHITLSDFIETNLSYRYMIADIMVYIGKSKNVNKMKVGLVRDDFSSYHFHELEERGIILPKIKHDHFYNNEQCNFILSLDEAIELTNHIYRVLNNQALTDQVQKNECDYCGGTGVRDFEFYTRVCECKLA